MRIGKRCCSNSYNQSAQLDFLLASLSFLPPTVTVHQVYLASLISRFDAGLFSHFGQRQPPEREFPSVSLIEQEAFLRAQSTITSFCKENYMSDYVTLNLQCCTKRFSVVIWVCLKSNKNIQL